MSVPFDTLFLPSPPPPLQLPSTPSSPPGLPSSLSLTPARSLPFLLPLFPSSPPTPPPPRPFSSVVTEAQVRRCVLLSFSLFCFPVCYYTSMHDFFSLFFLYLFKIFILTNNKKTTDNLSATKGLPFNAAGEATGTQPFFHILLTPLHQPTTRTSSLPPFLLFLPPPSTSELLTALSYTHPPSPFLRETPLFRASIQLLPAPLPLTPVLRSGCRSNYLGKEKWQKKKKKKPRGEKNPPRKNSFARTRDKGKEKEEDAPLTQTDTPTRARKQIWKKKKEFLYKHLFYVQIMKETVNHPHSPIPLRHANSFRQQRSNDRDLSPPPTHTHLRSFVLFSHRLKLRTTLHRRDAMHR